MDFSSSTSSARLLEPLCFILFTADIHYFINNPKFLITLPWVNSSQMTCRLMSVALLQLNSYLLVVLWLSLPRLTLMDVFKSPISQLFQTSAHLDWHIPNNSRNLTFCFLLKTVCPAPICIL